MVETQVDSEYCSARQNLESQLARHGFRRQAASADQSELTQPLPVSALGLAFQDFEHNRGSPQVVTPWELHPGIVNALP